MSWNPRKRCYHSQSPPTWGQQRDSGFSSVSSANCSLSKVFARHLICCHTHAVSHHLPPESGLISHSKLRASRGCLGTMSSVPTKLSTASLRQIFICSPLAHSEQYPPTASLLRIRRWASRPLFRQE